METQETNSVSKERGERKLSAKKAKRAQFKEVLAAGIKSGEVNVEINPAVVMLILERTIEAIFEDDFLKENDLNIKKALKAAQYTLFYGLLNRNNCEE